MSSSGLLMYGNIMKEIGNRLKNIRKNLNKSQEELARDLGLTKQAVSNMEHTKSFPSPMTMKKLHLDFGVNINYLLTGVGEHFVDTNAHSKSIKNELIKDIEDILNKRGIV